jgi:preprotein translocase subunit Sec63
MGDPVLTVVYEYNINII